MLQERGDLLGRPRLRLGLGRSRRAHDLGRVARQQTGSHRVLQRVAHDAVRVADGARRQASGATTTSGLEQLGVQSPEASRREVGQAQ
jgi:hypothetical protein